MSTEPNRPGEGGQMLRDEVADLITGYLERYPGATAAYTNDAVYHYTMKHLQAVLWLVAIAMHDEGIPEAMRVRVLRTALYGSAPSVDEAHDREKARAAELARLVTGARLDNRLVTVWADLDPDRPL